MTTTPDAPGLFLHPVFGTPAVYAAIRASIDATLAEDANVIPQLCRRTPADRLAVHREFVDLCLSQSSPPPPTPPTPPELPAAQMGTVVDVIDATPPDLAYARLPGAIPLPPGFLDYLTSAYALGVLPTGTLPRWDLTHAWEGQRFVAIAEYRRNPRLARLVDFVTDGLEVGVEAVPMAARLAPVQGTLPSTCFLSDEPLRLADPTSPVAKIWVRRCRPNGALVRESAYVLGLDAYPCLLGVFATVCFPALVVKHLPPLVADPSSPPTHGDAVARASAFFAGRLAPDVPLESVHGAIRYLYATVRQWDRASPAPVAEK